MCKVTHLVKTAIISLVIKVLLHQADVLPSFVQSPSGITFSPKVWQNPQIKKKVNVAWMVRNMCSSLSLLVLIFPISVHFPLLPCSEICQSL